MGIKPMLIFLLDFFYHRVYLYRKEVVEMKKMMILAVVTLSLMVNVGKANAWNIEKFGPVLDGDQMQTSKQFINY